MPRLACPRLPGIALLLAVGSAAAANPQDPLIAVLHFSDRLKDKSVDVYYIDDAVRAAALQARPGMRVMTRENQAALLRAAGKDPENCEGACEVETGRLLAADFIISGDLTRFGSSYKVILKMHDTASGQLIGGSQAAGKTLDELDAGLRGAVRELLQQALPVAPPQQAAPSQPQVARPVTVESQRPPAPPPDPGPQPAFQASVDPLGFLLFGPTAEAEFRAGEELGIAAGARLISLGLLKNFNNAANETTDSAWTGMAALRWYPQGVALRGYWIAPRLEVGRSVTNLNTDTLAIFLLEGGHRWVTHGGFAIGVSAAVGAIVFAWTYKPDQSTGTSASPVGGVMLTLGFAR